MFIFIFKSLKIVELEATKQELTKPDFILNPDKYFREKKYSEVNTPHKSLQIERKDMFFQIKFF